MRLNALAHLMSRLQGFSVLVVSPMGSRPWLQHSALFRAESHSRHVGCRCFPVVRHITETHNGFHHGVQCAHRIIASVLVFRPLRVIRGEYCGCQQRRPTPDGSRRSAFMRRHPLQLPAGCGTVPASPGGAVTPIEPFHLKHARSPH